MRGNPSYLHPSYLGHKPRPFEVFQMLQHPTQDEVGHMLNDLRDKLGQWSEVSVITGMGTSSLQAWLDGRRNPSKPAARCIWLYWVTICRPGAIETTWDLSTCGRFTKRGNPATAGQRSKRNPKSSPSPDNVTAQDDEVL